MAKRMLSRIEPGEVSLVDRPANKKKFLLCKADKMVIHIETSGEVAGTVIKVNDEELKEITGFSFNLYVPMDLGPGMSPSLSCNYSKIVEQQDGFKRTETYWLSKGDNTMNEELVTLLRELFGKADQNFQKQDLSEEAVSAIKDALKAVNKYKADFPEDLQKAIETLAEYAASGYGYPEKKSADAGVKPDNAGVAPTPGSQADPPKGPTDDMKALIESLNKSQKEGLEALSKSLGEFKTRLDKFESTVAVRKGIEGQDNGGNQDDDKDPFPSLKID